MHHIAVANGMINVFVKGKGDPVLFVHGFPLTHAIWTAQVVTLSESCRAIVPDLRGFGESTVTPEAVTMEQYADDMHALLHAVVVDKPIVFCGLSMGGYVGWQFFKKYRSQLKALILCDTRAAADTPEAAAGRVKLAATVQAQGPQAAFDAMLPRLFAPTTVENRPQIVEVVRSMVLRNKPAGIAAALLGMAERPDCRDLLPTIDVPTLLICGQDDQISTVDEMRSMAQAIPGAQFAEIPEAGHLAVIENPEAVNNAILKFLTTLR